MREVAHVKPEGDLRKRWFACRTCELFVWYDLAGEIVAFQFCYEAGAEREAIEWKRGHESHHAHVVDTSVAMKNRSHTLQFDDTESTAAALAQFERCCGTMDAALVAFVTERLAGEKSQPPVGPVVDSFAPPTE